MKIGIVSALSFITLSGCGLANNDPSKMTIAQKESLQGEHCKTVKKLPATVCECALSATRKVAGDEYEQFMTYASISFLTKLGRITKDQQMRMKNDMIDKDRNVLDRYNEIGQKVNEICLSERLLR